MKSLTTLRALKGKRVLVRVDFNVPHEEGQILDDSKMRAALPTIEYLQGKGARTILMSHLGKETDSLEPIRQRLERLLQKPVHFVAQWEWPSILGMVENLRDGEILMLQNLRMHEGEEHNSTQFAKDLASVAEVYVNESFGVDHRNHASLVGVPKYLPSSAGLLLAHEIKVLSGVMKKPQHPLILLLGGLKISTKIAILEHFVSTSDYVLLGGVMANTFLKAQGCSIGDSVYEEAELHRAKKLLDMKGLVLPVDVLVEEKSKIKNQKSKIKVKPPQQVQKGERIVDIGPETIKLYASYIRKSQTMIWNGPMGKFEISGFSHGSVALGRLIASRSKGKAFGVVGGGETLACLHKTKMAEYVDHVSTGGGAMLAFLAGEKLPGVEALQ